MGAAPTPSYRLLWRATRAPLLRGAVFLVGLLPLALALRLGAGLGRMVFCLARRQRLLALRHLTIAFPDLSKAERIRLGRNAFAELGRTALELCQARKLDRLIRSYVRWPEVEIEELRSALASGTGGIFVTGHLGNWELLARRIVAEGFDHVVVGREPGDRRLAALISDFRARGGVRVVGRGSGTLPQREILSALHRGALLGLLIDQDTRVQGKFVPFFGRLAHTPRAAEELALRGGLPVFVGFIHRQAQGGHLLHTERVQSGALTADLTARIEREIRTHPQDWVWMHRRWRQRPPN